MKVLLQSRSTLFSGFGGDTLLMEKTAQALKDQGIETKISAGVQRDLTGIDLIHQFNITRPYDLWPQLVYAGKAGIPVILTPLYLDYSAYDQWGRGGWLGFVSRLIPAGRLESMKEFARRLRRREWHLSSFRLLWSSARQSQMEILAKLDYLLANSESEIRRLSSAFPRAGTIPFGVAPCAVDIEQYNPDRVRLTREQEELRGCVLCVARIESWKNQLKLIEAMRTIDAPLVIIGKPAPNHLGYYRRLLRHQGERCRILGPVSAEALPGWYSVARVHVLPSWMETTGLSSLEAAAMGCAIVSTSRGDTREYFGDYADYCEPDSVESIRTAIAAAMRKGAPRELAPMVRKRYNWQATAVATAKAYQWILAQKRGHGN